MPYFSRNSVDIYFEYIYNNKEKNIVLINGVGGPIGYWLDIPSMLSHSFNVLVYDHRGIGKSSTPLFGYSVAEMERDLNDLVEYVGLKRYSVLGVSLGGMIAQHHVVSRNPDQIERLILASTHPGAVAATFPKLKNPLILLMVTHKFIGDMNLDEVLEFLSGGNLKQNNPELYSKLLESRKNEKKSNYYGFQGHVKAGSFYLGDDLSKIKVPVLILHGINDKLVPVENAFKIAKKIKKAPVEVKIYSSGHLMLWENSLEVVQDINDFIYKGSVEKGIQLEPVR